MTADEKLARIRGKVKWAEKHFDDFKVARQRFVDAKPYDYVLNDKPETGEVEIRMTRVETPPDEIGLIVGDVAHNLRSALDYIAYQLVFDGTKGQGIPARKRPFGHVHFPTAESADEYVATHVGKVQGMTKDAKNAIAATEPYQRGKGHYLWELHELDVIDKHRTPLTGIVSHVQTVISPRPMSPAEPWIFTVGEIDEPRFRRLLKTGDIVCTFKREDYENVQPTFDIAFGEPEVLKGKSIIETLKYLIQLVDGTIIELRPYLA